MIVYYAHCMAIYNTPQEDRDIETLHELFDDRHSGGGEAEVINPNSLTINAICERLRSDLLLADNNADVSQIIMDTVFKPLATTKSDALAFRALPDGSIPAGVAKEIEWAREHGNPILELPSNMTRRTMSVPATREYLREIGQR